VIAGTDGGAGALQGREVEREVVCLVVLDAGVLLARCAARRWFAVCWHQPFR
jgi:hypothetical protein